jgi:acyl-CoA hydrolase
VAIETFTIVRPEHLNHHGFLFGGQLLLWVDEFAWLAAARENPGRRLVTRAMDHIDFSCPVPVGSILRFRIGEVSRGRTSLRYAVDVLSDEPGACEEKQVFSTVVTFVSVSKDGEKQDLGCTDPDLP